MHWAVDWQKLSDVALELVRFAGKGAIIFATFAVCAVFLFVLSRRGGRHAGRITVQGLNGRYRDMVDTVRAEVLEPKAYKQAHKEEVRKHKAELKDGSRPNVFVIDFHGDILASHVENLREEITSVLAVAKPNDEVLVRLESAGGTVTGYGLAASQLARLRQANLALTVSIDRVAASGGYMMACVAKTILAAPFAVVGSIGVTAPVPNLHRLLREHGVDYQDISAGEYKRTVSLLGEITDKGRQKFQEQIEATHSLFKEFVRRHRPTLAVDAVATGEYWHGTDAVRLGLVDAIQTSDDYLIGKLATANLYALHYRRPQRWRERLGAEGKHLLKQALAVPLVEGP